MDCDVARITPVTSMIHKRDADPERALSDCALEAFTRAPQLHFKFIDGLDPICYNTESVITVQLVIRCQGKQQ